jgi:hypothetical protein
MVDLRLKDKTKLYVKPTFDVGSEIFIITKEGNVHMPDGSFQLIDYTVIDVKDGLIIDIKLPPKSERVSMRIEQLSDILSKKRK